MCSDGGSDYLDLQAAIEEDSAQYPGAAGHAVGDDGVIARSIL